MLLGHFLRFVALLTSTSFVAIKFFFLYVIYTNPYCMSANKILQIQAFQITEGQFVSMHLLSLERKKERKKEQSDKNFSKFLLYFMIPLRFFFILSKAACQQRKHQVLQYLHCIFKIKKEIKIIKNGKRRSIWT